MRVFLPHSYYFLLQLSRSVIRLLIMQVIELIGLIQGCKKKLIILLREVVSKVLEENIVVNGNYVMYVTLADPKYEAVL